MKSSNVSQPPGADAPTLSPAISPSISVAMATYNGARFIGEQLASIAAQTLLPAELVVTDDGSSDNTVAIVRAFAGTAPFPVHVHCNATNLGFRSNFMHAIALCTSDVIALCDQDDVWVPTKLERTIVPFGEDDVVLAYHEAWLIDETGEPLGLAHIHAAAARNPPSSLFPMSNPYGFSMLFRRELAAFGDLWPRSVDNLHSDTPMAHDQWLFFLASALGTIAFVDEPLAGYRQHGSNTYGLAAPATTSWQKVRRLINVRSKEFASFAIGATARADVLEEVKCRLDPLHAGRMVHAVHDYRALARRCAKRAIAFDAARSVRRLGAWWWLLRDGGYGDGTRWTFGRKAGIKDLCYLLLPRGLLRRMS